MAKIIHDYIDKTDRLVAEIEKSADSILRGINLKELLKNPREYLKVHSQKFVMSHKDKIQEGIEAGKEFGEKVMSNVKSKN